eukprot:s1444_g9.t1
MPWAIRALSILALLCPAMSDQREDTCEDSALLAKTYRTLQTSLANAEVMHQIAEASDAKGPTDCPDEASLNAGICTGLNACANCYTSASPPVNDVPPNATLDGFPNGRLFCGNGVFVCKGSKFNFKNANDYLQCREFTAAQVCGESTITNVGAVCCVGNYACGASTFSLSSAGGCQTDMCCGEFGQLNIFGTCSGGSASVMTRVTGVRTMSCRGRGACLFVDAKVLRDVICEEPEFNRDACSFSTFQVIAGGDHVVDCIGPSCIDTEFDFAPNSNIAFTCNGNIPACRNVEISLNGSSCIDLNCTGTGCQGLTVTNTSTDMCYYQGDLATRPDGCLATPMPMCGNIQRAPICCRGGGAGGGCADCCPDPTSSTSSTTPTTETTSSTTTATRTTSASTAGTTSSSMSSTSGLDPSSTTTSTRSIGSTTAGTATSSSTTTATTTKRPYSQYGRNRRARRARRWHRWSRRNS